MAEPPVGNHLTIGTRGSALALWQSEWVAAELRRLHVGLAVDLHVIRTRGDQITDRPLTEVGGKGLFVKEIEAALLSGEVDLAVHSLKDVPSDIPAGLHLAAFPPREDPRDVLVCREASGLRDLPSGATVATSSLRRMAQLRHLRPDLRFVPLRGNVDTRLRKLREGEADAIVLAAAGLRRLGLETAITEWLSPEQVVPAAGQGILCLETREADESTRSLVGPLDDPVSRLCAQAERRVVSLLEGSCEVPLGALAEVRDGSLHLVAVLSDLARSRLLRASAAGPTDDPLAVADQAIARLRDLGADQIIEDILRSCHPPSTDD